MSGKISKKDSPLNEGLFLLCSPCEEKLKRYQLVDEDYDMRRAVKKLMGKAGVWKQHRIIKSNCHGNCPKDLLSILVCGLGKNTQNTTLLCSPTCTPQEILDACLNEINSKG
ncbi:hypothetical protein MJH12_01845 [bacterium]|nr:hypothetical protein [bacterium]